METGKRIIEQIVRLEINGDETKAEVVGEIVRCMDCKYGHMFADMNVIPLLSCNYKNAHGMLVENHGYCKWGKRKETEE